MACIESRLEGLVAFRRRSSARYGRDGAGDGLDLCDDSGGCRGLDDVVAAVVLAAMRWRLLT